jgi:NDP-sugar pyrophosphorylase family protein
VKKNFKRTDNFIHYSKWDETILTTEANIEDVLKNLNKSGSRITLIINKKKEFKGTISDGDIRRALINGANQKTSIKKIINNNSLIVSPEIKHETVLELMIKNKIQQIPVINKNKKIVGLYLWDEVVAHKKIPNTLVIMAGGKGTRLGKYTKNCPKPLLPVNGKPMLEVIIERAKAQGFENFLISINYLGHMIKDYFSNGKKWNVKIDYIKEDQPLGTCGALKLISPKPNLSFVVSNCDIMTDFHYGELLDFHRNHNAEATMAVQNYEWENPYGVVQTKGVDIIKFEEKPIIRSHINAGVYVLEPSAIDVIKKNEKLDMPNIFERLKKKNLRTIVYPVHEPWLDIGIPEDYYKVK